MKGFSTLFSQAIFLLGNSLTGEFSPNQTSLYLSPDCQKGYRLNAGLRQRKLYGSYTFIQTGRGHPKGQIWSGSSLAHGPSADCLWSWLSCRVENTFPNQNVQPAEAVSLQKWQFTYLCFISQPRAAKEKQLCPIVPLDAHILFLFWFSCPSSNDHKLFSCCHSSDFSFLVI